MHQMGPAGDKWSEESKIEWQIDGTEGCGARGSGKPLWRESIWASLVAQMVKSLPAMKEAGVQALGGEDPLETGTATHSSILAWSVPWTEEPGGLWSIGPQRVGHD